VVVSIAVPLLLLVLLAYLVRHRRHKLSTAFLGFLIGALIADTAIGHGITATVTGLIATTLTAIGGMFT
jgi:hypothetical protein